MWCVCSARLCHTLLSTGTSLGCDQAPMTAGPDRVLIWGETAAGNLAVLQVRRALSGEAACHSVLFGQCAMKEKSEHCF